MSGRSSDQGANAARPFHHESAFIRLRPHLLAGSWDGQEMPGACSPPERPRRAASAQPPTACEAGNVLCRCGRARIRGLRP